MFKYITSLLILLVLISCSSENSFEDEKSSSLIKPNFFQIQARYDCALSKDTSLNRLEAFIPNFVIKVKDALPSASLEIFFNDQENINNFSLRYIQIIFEEEEASNKEPFALRKNLQYIFCLGFLF